MALIIDKMSYIPLHHEKLHYAQPPLPLPYPHFLPYPYSPLLNDIICEQPMIKKKKFVLLKLGNSR